MEEFIYDIYHCRLPSFIFVFYANCTFSTQIFYTALEVELIEIMLDVYNSHIMNKRYYHYHCCLGMYCFFQSKGVGYFCFQLAFFFGGGGTISLNLFNL